MTANSLYRCHNFHFKFLIQKSTEKRSRANRIKLSPGTQSGHDSNRRGSSQLSPYPLPKYGCNAYAFFLRYVQVRYVHFPVLPPPFLFLLPSLLPFSFLSPSSLPLFLLPVFSFPVFAHFCFC